MKNSSEFQEGLILVILVLAFLLLVSQVLLVLLVSLEKEYFVMQLMTEQMTHPWMAGQKQKDDPQRHHLLFVWFIVFLKRVDLEEHFYQLVFVYYLVFLILEFSPWAFLMFLVLVYRLIFEKSQELSWKYSISAMFFPHLLMVLLLHLLFSLTLMLVDYSLFLSRLLFLQTFLCFLWVIFSLSHLRYHEYRLKMVTPFYEFLMFQAYYIL